MIYPKLIITDIDGVWTDGGMYYLDSGSEIKKFNTSDSAGVLFCRILDIPLCVITGEDSESVKNRMNKLGIKWYYPGAKNKLQIALELCEKLTIELKDVAFIGDDINDISLLANVGYSASVANAPEYVKENVNYVTQKNGGEGAFREFIEHILHSHGKLKDTIKTFVATASNFSQ